jgi:hypothetical protein
MNKANQLYRGYRFPAEIISHVVWLYHRFCLSFRDIEDLLAERGIVVSYETIRSWTKCPLREKLSKGMSVSVGSVFAAHRNFPGVRFSGFSPPVIAHDAIARRKNARPGTPRQMPVLTRNIRIGRSRVLCLSSLLPYNQP